MSTTRLAVLSWLMAPRSTLPRVAAAAGGGLDGRRAAAGHHPRSGWPLAWRRWPMPPMADGISLFFARVLGAGPAALLRVL